MERYFCRDKKDYCDILNCKSCEFAKGHGVIDGVYANDVLSALLGESYDLDHLKQLIEADREGRCVVLPCKPGHEVWIVERDEDEEPECITGYVFLTQIKGYVIVAGFLNGSGNIDEILEDQAGQTLIEYNGDLPVFPACDCYLDKESALKAMKESENDDRA